MSIKVFESILNGPQIEMDSDFMDKLWYGDKILGWEGDVNLRLYYNREKDRVELWRLVPGGGQVGLIQSKPGQRMVDMNLIHWLVTHDAQRGFDVKKSIDEHNAKVQAEADRVADEAIAEAEDKVNFAIKQDLKGTIYQ